MKSLRRTLRSLGLLSSSVDAELPTFLIISPPKTGSSWLSATIGSHPECCTPLEKETHFFSWLHRHCDLQWYADRFRHHSARVRGESTPTYSILPTATIEAIRELIPDLKLIYLMRDPVERAWSHAKHSWKHREGNFRATQPPFEDVSDDLWIEAFTDDWLCVNGDYLGQLRRWSAVFPREQMFVGFFESIAREPRSLLERIFRFLGVDDPPWSEIPYGSRINDGINTPLSSSLRSALRQILSRRTAELTELLQRRFSLTPPSEWAAADSPQAVEDPAAAGPTSPADCSTLARTFERLALLENDDGFLGSVVAMERKPQDVFLLEPAFLGYSILLHHGRVYGLRAEIPARRLAGLDAVEASRLHAEGLLVSGSHLADVKHQIVQQSNCALAAMQQERAALLKQIEEIAASRGHLQATLELTARERDSLRDDLIAPKLARA